MKLHNLIFSVLQKCFIILCIAFQQNSLQNKKVIFTLNIKKSCSLYCIRFMTRLRKPSFYLEFSLKQANPLHLDFLNRTTNISMVLPISKIKIWGKSFHGFMGYYQKSKKTKWKILLIFIYWYLYYRNLAFFHVLALKNCLGNFTFLSWIREQF